MESAPSSAILLGVEPQIPRIYQTSQHPMARQRL